MLDASPPSDAQLSSTITAWKARRRRGCGSTAIASSRAARSSCFDRSPIDSRSVARGSTSARSGSSSVAGLALDLLVGVLLAVRMRRNRPREEADRIAAHYGHLIVPVGPSTDVASRPVQVASIEALVRLAEHAGALVLHEQSRFGDSYLVRDGATVYEMVPWTASRRPRTRSLPDPGMLPRRIKRCRGGPSAVGARVSRCGCRGRRSRLVGAIRGRARR